ncbi:MAG: hypothetical protein MJ108_02550 [Saccharofermentans sp.]|nr:hypothetical protein [Saccharofermentans sp.]
MAIWDQKEEVLVTTESADSHKCISCGGNLKFHIKEGMLVCLSCGNRFYPESFEINEMLSERMELDIKPEDLEKNSDEVDSYKIERETKQEIVCNACGAVVVTDKNTTATFCSFCGSPAIVNRRLQKEFRPDYIVPFKLNHKQAEENIRQWSKSRVFLPSSFNTKATYDKITGVYIPCWLVDADCNMDVGGVGIKKDPSMMGNELLYYNVRRKGLFKMKNVPFDGTKRISNKMMEAIEPFDYSEMVPFADGYLPGFYAERYDQTPKDMVFRIADRFRDYMYEVGSMLVKSGGYKEFHLENDFSKPENYKCHYALLPVWLLSYNYKGAIYRVAVNGQTGEVAGKAPESDIKRGLWKIKEGIKSYSIVLLIATILSFIVGTGVYFNSYRSRNFSSGSYLLICGIACAVSYILVLCNALGIRFMSNSPLVNFVEKLVIKSRVNMEARSNEINKMDTMPDVYEYLDKSWKADIEETDMISAYGVAQGMAKDMNDLAKDAVVDAVFGGRRRY